MVLITRALEGVGPGGNHNQSWYFKLLRSPKINSKELIPPAYVAMASRYDKTILSPHRLF
jgi:hypothetical protein